MNPYVLLVIAAGLFGAGFKLGMEHEQASQAREDAHIAEAVDAATNVAARTIAALKPTYTTIQSKVQHEVETKTVYRDCKLSADGLLLANQALNGGNATTGDGKLPKADPTR